MLETLFSFPFSFSCHSLPSLTTCPPHYYFLFFYSILGIISGSCTDFLSKFQGVCVVDEYGNIRSVDYDGPEPIMTVSFQKPKITVQTTPEIDEEENAEECKDNSRSSTSSLGKKASKRKRGEKDNNDRCFFSSFFCQFCDR